MTADCAIRCGPECERIFKRIRVFPLIEGGTRVEWTLDRYFLDPGPFAFQLQLGRTGSSSSDDWTDVGASVVDSFYAIDASKRVYGKMQWTHYRVLLTTALATYASRPQNCLGDLSKRDWLRAREIARLEVLRLKKEAGQEGYLLKRRLFGTACDCLDTMTEEIRDPECDKCYGTGFDGGYFAPVSCFFAELRPSQNRSELDSAAARGTIDDLPRTSGRMINSPQIHSYDIWVDRDTDFRWAIHSIKHAVEVRGVPVVLDPVEMRLLPYSHPIYTFSIDGQISR